MAEDKSKDCSKFSISEIDAVTPESIQTKIDSVASNIATKRQAPLMVVYYPDLSRISMRPRDVSFVYAKIQKIKKINTLDVMIHSGGGDIHTAYKLAKLFQRYTKELRIIIPEYAKSAATLLALSAHQIEMSVIAELGPLDPIIQIGDQVSVPAFAIRNSIKVLEKEIATCEDEEVRELKAEFILGPIAVKLDPYLLSAVSDTPELATRYGKKLLGNIGYDEKTAKRILKNLIERGHPSHGYVIDFEEARSIGLKAKEIKTDDEVGFSLLLLLLRSYEKSCLDDENPIRQPIIELYIPEIKSPKASKKKEKTTRKKRS